MQIKISLVEYLRLSKSFTSDEKLLKEKFDKIKKLAEDKENGYFDVTMDSEFIYVSIGEKVLLPVLKIISKMKKPIASLAKTIFDIILVFPEVQEPVVELKAIVDKMGEEPKVSQNVNFDDIMKNV